MKTKVKFIICLLSLLVVTCYPCAKIQAQNNETYSITESLPNGYYATIYVEVSNVSARSSIITASKVYDITNSSNEVVASFKLTGTSTYPYNSSVKCTSATYSTKINDSKWSFSNCSASTSGNSAIGCFTAKNKIAGITISTIEKSIILSCDKNGNIS